MTRPPVVVLVGAARRRHGIGPHVARHLHAEGSHLAAIVGTTAETVAAAGASLAGHGIAVTGYTSLDRALEHEQPDAVVLCSPYAAHRDQLKTVAAWGAHCLCEKPLWWGEAADRGRETAALVDAFVDAGRHLALMTQWPCTLAVFYQIFSQLRAQPVTRFAMGLSPGVARSEMILDSGPHLVSMLQALLGSGRAAAVVASGDADVVDLQFGYEHAAGTTSVSFQMSRTDRQPRPAWYEIDGCRVDRRIEGPDYGIVFDGRGAVSLPVPDPVRETVRQFLSRVRHGAPTDRRLLLESVSTLEVLDAAGRRIG